MAGKTTNTKKKTNSRKTNRNVPPPPPKKSGQSTTAPKENYGGNILGGFVFVLLAGCSVISYFNTEGSFVSFFSDWLRGLLGWGFYLAAPAFAIAAFHLFTSGDRPIATRVFATVMLPILLAALSHLMMSPMIKPGIQITEAMNDMFLDGQQMKSGGVLGGLIANGLNKTLSVYGALPLLIVGFVYCFVLCFWGSLRGLVTKITESHSSYVRYEQERSSISAKRTIKDSPEKKTAKIIQGTRRGIMDVDIPLGEDEDELDLFGEKRITPKATSTRPAKGPKIIREPVPEFDSYQDSDTDSLPSPQMKPQENSASKTKAPVKPKEVAKGPKQGKGPKAEKTSSQEIEKEREKIEQVISGTEITDDYVFPPLELLRASSGIAADATDEVNLNRRRLEEAIQSFGISAAVVGVIRGPTVTRYDIELDRGVKLSRITNLAGDLALSLGVVNVRIAPIPDKISTVGIEVPNRTVSTVFLRDILDSGNFSGAKSKLSFALGKDIGGNCIVGNISKLPHLLIAGTTGSGKSVCMNSLILSLLYKARPDEVKLIMIDPKMVELGIYNGIPHLYVPVVTDPKKAAGALQWSVVEMLKRYRAFSEEGVRDLDAYNRIRKAQGEETLPRVVIVIDELADLMLVASKDVEESICRVAQMGRAAGMHLVIATQRPSADVITGLMKANIPSRIAFAVSSSLESRIILDQGGAEKLIGFGDMLYAPIGTQKPTRIQGSFVSDEEREDVINFIKEHSKVAAEKNSEIEDYMIKATKEKNGREDKASETDSPAGDYDEMLPQAAEVVLEMGSCSVSMLQRRLKLGYSRAARIVDQMEELGIVGPYEGAKPRGVAIDREGWNELQIRLGFLSPEALPEFGADDDSDLDAGDGDDS